LNLAGINIVNQDKAAAKKDLDKAALAQKISIIIYGKTYSYTAKDLGIKRDFSALLDSAYAPPNTLMNKLATDQSQKAKLNTYVQKKKFISAIEANLGQYKVAQDASVSISGATLTVNPSKVGITLNFDQIINRVENSNLGSSLTITAKYTQKAPDIPTEAAQAAKDQAVVLTQPVYGVTTDSGSNKFASLAQKNSWLVFTPSKTDHSIGVSINTKAAVSSMTKLAQSFGQPVKNRVTLTATDGSTSVIDNGQNGLVVDQTTLNDGLTQFRAALAARQTYSLPIKLVVQPQGERNLGTATGGKFVLVDIAAFKAYAINNTTVDRTMLVSTGMPGMPTHTGHFTILRKTKLVTMRGCNVKVGCWVVPNVPNAEFFTGDGEALHGTYWHNQFGKKNLSHGCVNLSLADAAWLFDWTVVGTDVVVV
jgi:lipoprotein-anchoring transpeptidase ErfK/SrfK